MADLADDIQRAYAHARHERLLAKLDAEELERRSERAHAARKRWAEQEVLAIKAAQAIDLELKAQEFALRPVGMISRDWSE